MPPSPRIPDQELFLDEEELVAYIDTTAVTPSSLSEPVDVSPTTQLRSSLSLPPLSVFPPTLRLEPLRTSPIASRGIGLLRKLSIYSTYLRGIYEAYELNSGRPVWSVVTQELFGTTSKDEFIGYGRFSVPGHDSLGQFPLFRDEQGREYFDGAIGGQEDITISCAFGNITMAMRVPRSVTRAHNATVVSHAKSPDQDPAFPQPGEKLKLKIAFIPFLPFYYNRDVQTISSIREEEKRDNNHHIIPPPDELFNTRYVTLQTNITKHRWYDTVIEAEVVSSDSHRNASCGVELKVASDPHITRVFSVQVMREEWCINVKELFIDLIKFDKTGLLTLAVIDYIKTKWLPAVGRWRKDT